MSGDHLSDVIRLPAKKQGVYGMLKAKVRLTS